MGELFASKFVLLFGGVLLIVCHIRHVTSQSSLSYTSVCAHGSSPIYALYHNATRGNGLRTLPANSLVDCSEICSGSNDCIGIDYVNGQCVIIGAADVPYKPAKLAEGQVQGSRVLLKSCVKSERICASPFHFDAHEQKILVGFAREVVAADNIQSCLSACLNAFDNFGFECESVMYYPTDFECILNTEDRLDRPDLFVDEHNDQVIYLDNNCAGSQCYAPYVTQYVAVEGRLLQDELDRTVHDIDQTACEELCTQRLAVVSNEEAKLNFNCKSFMYRKDTRTCILSDERSKPLGRASLVDGPNYTYYEKKCFASPKTCRNVPSFTRVPQMLLVGFASFVMENVPSSMMCLDQCTNPPPETGEKFVCKSVMYYYNEQECILNAESRHSKPDLFIPEEDDFVVDYFDISCHLDAEQCPGGEFFNVKTLNAALPEGDQLLHVFTTAVGSVEECKEKCVVSAPEKCRSFNYDKVLKSCSLMYLDGRGSLRPQPKTSVDLYDLHCLQPPRRPGCLNKDGTLFSRYLYTKQQGMQTNEFSSISLSKCLNLCSTGERCEGVNYNRRDGQCTLFAEVGLAPGEKNEHIDFYKNLCLVKEVDTGESSAINVPKLLEPLQTVSTQRPSRPTKPTKDQSVTAVKSELGDVDDLAFSRVPPPKPVKIQPNIRGVINEPLGVPITPGVSAPEATFDVRDVEPSMPKPVHIPTHSVHTICNYEGILIRIKHDHPFTGVIFVKNKYDSCRVEVTNSDAATLVLGLPANFGMKPISLNTQTTLPKKKPAPATINVHGGVSTSAEKNDIRRRRQMERDCGLIDMDNGTYKTVVVVQTNNLGIPGLVTSMDQLYEVSCNYSSMLGGKVTAATNLTVQGPQPALIQPRGKIELGNPVLMQMREVRGVNATISQQPLVQAKLGDILELRWEIMAMDNEIDFFIRDCFAEPGLNGNSTKERLQLIEKGCPTPSVAQNLIPTQITVVSSAVKIARMRAFRFDSSSTVRITCNLELCKGDCSPVKCHGEKDSWGRKKRDLGPQALSSKSNATHYETKRYKVPRFAMATTSLVIVDPLQQLSDPLFAAQYASHSSVSKQSTVASANVVAEQQPSITSEPQPQQNVRCMSKWTVGGILGSLFALIVCQSVMVGKHLVARITAVPQQHKK